MVSPVRILLVWLLALCSLQARRLPFKTYTTGDGLARDRIQCIVQDRNGFLWLCTAEGLSRFDGYRFINYGTEQGLPHNNVTAMLATKEGTYWVGTMAGLCRFDPAATGAAKFRHYSLPGDKSSQHINVLRQDRNGALWVGTDAGLFRLLKSGIAFQRLDLDTNTQGSRAIASLMEDRRGALWVSTHGGLYRRDPDGRTHPFRDWFDRSRVGVLAMLEDRDGRLWFGADEGVWRLDASSAPIQYLPELRVYSLMESSAGKIWIGTSSGLTEWVPQARGTDREFESYDMRNGLGGRQVGELTEDRDRNLWIGTDGGGLMRMAPSGFLTYYAEDGLMESRTDSASSIFETRQGVLCFWQQSVISRFDGRHFHPTRLKVPSDITYFGWGRGRLVLQDRTGDWWIATGQGLCRFPPVTLDQLGRARPKAVYRVADGLLGNNIFQLFEDSRGDIWISQINTVQRDGVARFERKTGRIQAFSDADGFASSSSPSGFAEDRAGNVWMGCHDGSLARFGNGRFTMFSDSLGIPAGGWKVPYVDSAGRLWVGARRGLGRADNPTEETPRFVTYTTAQGLASSEVKAITEDRSGNIYAATGRGVDRIEVQAGGIAVTKHYTHADGLAAGELAGAYRDRGGSLWFVTNLGLSQLTPTPDQPPNAPPILVTGLQIGTLAHPISDVGQTEVTGLRVRPGQGPLRIDFVGLSFAPGERLRYQYHLEGLDRDWSAPTDQRTVVYGSLATGRYRFLVRAINSAGMASPVPAGVSFTMLPPFWLSWWFLLAAVLGTAALVFTAHCYRVQQLLAVERVRTRIATDLHDDIGSSLSQISILSELVRQRLNTSDPLVSQPLAEIANVSGETVASLSDIVWAINPRHDRLSDLSARMRRFAFDVLGGRGIELHFEAYDRQQRLRTNSDFRRQVYLIFKEAVNNSARHARCTRAVVELHVENGRLELCMSDNGAGFEPSSTDHGNGLVNMRRRAIELGGELDFRSEPGRGTELKLSVPLPGSRTS